MKQMTVRISDQQERILKKSADKTKKSIVGYVRCLIDCDTQKQSQDIPPELKPLEDQYFPNLQPKIIELLYRILFLKQVSFGKTFPDEYEDIQDMVDERAKVALDKFLSEL